MTIGESIRKAREKENYSRRQVAIRCKISEHTLRSWEMDISSPSVDLLVRVADMLKISLDELVGRKLK